MKYYLAEELLISSFIINKCQNVLHIGVFCHTVTYKINKGNKQFKSVCLPLLKSLTIKYLTLFIGSIGSLLGVFKIPKDKPFEHS